MPPTPAALDNGFRSAPDPVNHEYLLGATPMSDPVSSLA